MEPNDTPSGSYDASGHFVSDPASPATVRIRKPRDMRGRRIRVMLWIIFGFFLFILAVWYGVYHALVTHWSDQ